MISVDTVYQRVLAILNKENRGYITPQEFNLMANQAQLEIFEQYFYDLNQFKRLGSNSSEYADITNNIEEKISIFEITESLITENLFFTTPENLYRIGSIFNNNIEICYVSEKELQIVNASPLTSPSSTYPVYTKKGTSIYVYPYVSSVSLNYIKIPSTVQWAYNEVSGIALYDSSNSINFEIHESDEPSLVIKILSYAGLSIKQPEITQVVEGIDNKKITQEKS
jgi:hypothetical protein